MPNDDAVWTEYIRRLNEAIANQKWFDAATIYTEMTAYYSETY